MGKKEKKVKKGGGGVRVLLLVLCLRVVDRVLENIWKVKYFTIKVTVHGTCTQHGTYKMYITLYMGLIKCILHCTWGLIKCILPCTWGLVHILVYRVPVHGTFLLRSCV